MHGVTMTYPVFKFMVLKYSEVSEGGMTIQVIEKRCYMSNNKGVC